MTYPLFHLHQLIDELFQSEQDLLGQAASDSLSIIHKATAEAKAFPLAFMQQAAGAKNSKALQVLLHTCQAGCTSLLNKVTAYKMALENETGSHSKNLYSAVQPLEEAVLNDVWYLQQHFPVYFNKEQQVPLVYKLQVQMELKQQTQSLIAQWAAGSIDPELQSIALSPLHRFINAQPAEAYSFQQVEYLRGLQAALTAVSGSQSADLANLNCIDTLISLNFNHPALMQYSMQYLYRQVSLIALPQDQATQWALHEKRFGQAYSGTQALLPGSPSAKETLVSMIQQEIKYATRQQNALAAVYGGQPAASAAPKGTVLTTLSVSQLAVFIRLLFDCGIIEHGNQAELLRLMAGVLKTTRAASISADSLRNKFYDPDAAAINIIKEHLNQMLSRIRKY